ncbi:MULTISPECIES: GPW/gp25 family protein [unclassified Fibrobacter]|uniref:GPW/gp25 family protein n=1 Tax=unclassified Fibrobacter TaxID=2634177 RepID=UPI0018EE84E8|nr:MULTISPECIES: GPW/gp25 family protein [unclassified Fibrobacter]
MFARDFLGRGWKFPLSFSMNGVEMSETDEDIRESLRILLSTYPGERIMRPDFGCRIRDYCFRAFDEEFKALLKDEIRRAILFHESRIDVDDILVTKPDDSDAVNVEILYTVRMTNSRSNLVFPFYINEGTDVTL